MGEAVAPDIGSHPWRPGDLLVLCSDGVWEPITDARIGELVSDPDSPAEVLASALCTAALEAGSRDNVTAVICRRVR